MKYWLLSDTHYGHRMLVDHGYRAEGFESLLAKNWQAMVGAGDVLFHLGDVAIGHEADSHFEHIQQMPGRKILVRGNHDSRSLGWYMSHGWDFACDAFEIDYAGKRILFTHRPAQDVRVFDINIHGHLHAIPEKSHRRNELLSFYGEKHILVAVELTKYRPVLLDTVVAQHAKRIGGAK